MDEFTSSGESLEESGFDRRANRDKTDRDFDGTFPFRSLYYILLECFSVVNLF